MDQSQTLRNLSSSINEVASGNINQTNYAEVIQKNVEQVKNFVSQTSYKIEHSKLEKNLFIAKILACIPLLHVAAPFLLQGPTSWLGWLQIVSIITFVASFFIKSSALKIGDTIFMSVLFIYGIVFTFTFKIDSNRTLNDVPIVTI